MAREARRRRIAPAVSVGLRLIAFAYLIALVVGIVVYKAAFIESIPIDPYFALYGLVVATYILSRFALSLFYRRGKDHGIEPSVAIVVPAFNEEDAVIRTVKAALDVDYPADRARAGRRGRRVDRPHRRVARGAGGQRLAPSPRAL